MKKPKKIAAARTPSKAPEAKPSATSKKPVAKRARKSAAAAPEAPPSSEVKSIGAPKPAAEIKPALKPDPTRKTARPKKIAKTIELKAEPLPEAKPLKEAKVKTKGAVKARSAAAIKISPPKPTAPVLSAPPVAPNLKPKPAAGIKPKSRNKGTPAATPPAAAAPAVESNPVEEKPIAPVKPKAPTRPRAKAKLVVVVKAVGESKPTPRPPENLQLEVPAKEEPEVRKVPTPVPMAPLKQSLRPIRKAPANIPPILLEGDQNEPAPVSGPGHRYALGPTPPVEKLQTEGELPKAYGTGSLLLTARDPHWLYAHWDFTDEQQRHYNAFSREGHMVVRVYVETPGSRPSAEVPVHPESRHWFVHVEKANTRYVAELGYYSAAEKWKVVATSAATLTPPEAVSTETAAEFGTIPFEVPMGKLLSLVKEAVHENAPLAQALQELRADGHMKLPEIALSQPEPSSPTGQTSASSPQPEASAPAKPRRRSATTAWKPSEWTPAQERALAEVVSMDHVRRVWMGSLEITELIRRQLSQEQFPQNVVELGAVIPGAPTSPTGAIGAVGEITSPSGKPAQLEKGFWFNVNAELIVYGATEPDATVSIGGRKIKLRPDGSFSYRFALPDGNYEMPVVAVSADQTDGRAAELKFSRDTQYRGHVEAHPQDPALQPLRLENF